MDTLRISIMGRFFDIPKDRISNDTLLRIQKLMDVNNAINPLDLLKEFLECSEENIKLEEILNEASNKIANYKTKNPLT
ncbi:hypothetical protein B6S12_04565 [Helicobacter valdiviensis]|uniref:Uncharacterized protein n=1 Tax=Helicobacter valdiviensis TaxID=1458358 RepID=A0A2W6MUX5_9HELI|nr:hypothetical protein [Helicobacter valdiviensis]PZT48334.1 hypothetical protein B6S12_04565 [Helicobacter valdiviensis]